MTKSKIVLEQHHNLASVQPGKLRYNVISLTNRTRPMVGETLNEDEVNKLQSENDGLTIEIKPSSSKRR